MGLSAIALGGLDRALTQFQSAAARAGSAGGSPEAGLDIVDLSDAAVSMLAARNQFDANIAVLKTADQMERHALDILA